MSTAVIRCCCRRCVGRIFYLSPVEFLEAHQLGPGEFVLDCEAHLVIDHGRTRSLFDYEMDDDDL